MALTKMDSVVVAAWCSSARDCFNASKPAGSSVVSLKAPFTFKRAVEMAAPPNPLFELKGQKQPVNY
jgi:hypothetical protein